MRNQNHSTQRKHRANYCLPADDGGRELLIDEPLTVMPEKYEVAGVPVSATSYDEITQVLLRCANEKRPTIVDFTCVDVIVRAIQDPLFRSVLDEFDILCPDGQPVRWLLNSAHSLRLIDRVCGTTAMIRLCGAAAERGVGIYLYGSTDATLDKLQKRLRELYPTLRIVGLESPPFRALSEAEDASVVHRVNGSGAGFLFIGLGAPKQERFAWEHRHSIKAVQLCVGAAFDFVAGTKSRAPLAMQRIGLEWLYRCFCEPRRLAKRYIVGNGRFIGAAVRQLYTRQTRARTMLVGDRGPK